jgi:hypothetical protein
MIRDVLIAHLKGKFARNEMVTCCWEPSCDQHKVSLNGPEFWVEYPKREYDHYSHGICPFHYMEIVTKKQNRKFSRAI